MPRIIIINRRYCPGEAWTGRILAYARGLSELGVQVVLCYLIGDKHRTKYKIDIPGVSVMNFWENDGFFAKRNRHLSYMLNLFRARKYIKKGDVVFIYNAEKWILKSCYKREIRIYTEITEHPYVYDKNKKRSKRTIDKRMLRLKRCNGTCVISKNLKKYLESVGIPKEKICIVNILVDTQRFLGLEKKTTEPYIAYCGVVSYNKDGVDQLIKSFALFHKEHPDYKLYIIGKGERDDTLEKLKKLATNLGILENVVFTGFVDANKIPQILYDAKILALSRPKNLQAENGFPTKLGEYLMTGNPVIVTRVGEIPDFIIDRQNGILANPDDPNDFAEKLCWIADNYPLAEKIGNKGKCLSLDFFSYKVQSQKLLEFIYATK